MPEGIALIIVQDRQELYDILRSIRKRENVSLVSAILLVQGDLSTIGGMITRKERVSYARVETLSILPFLLMNARTR